MKRTVFGNFLKSILSMFCLFFLSACIETDIEDPFATSLRIVEPEETFRVNGQYELVAEYTDDTGELASVPVTWESSDPQIIRIEGSTAHCLAEGQVFLNASAEGKTETLLISVAASREFIEITNFVGTLQVGNSFTFQVTYMDVAGNAQQITPDWSSSSESVATVNASGQVTANAEGTAVITAAFGNVSHQINLQTSNTPVLVDPEVRITTFTMFMQEGTNFTFIAQYFGDDGQPDPGATINWSSSSASVLTIDQNGVANAVSAGTATVTASSGGLSATIDVIVETPVTQRTGSLAGTGYNISGTFVLSINNDGELILNITNYVPAGPGPYFYLTNQAGNVTNGLNLGAANTSGNIEINVTSANPSVGLFTYDYLVIWCEPFRVRLGFGQFDN